MYKLILSDKHKQILKEAFVSYYKIRQNYWDDFISDLKCDICSNDADSSDTCSSNAFLFESAYKAACPDYKEIYKVIRKDGEIVKVEGFNISIFTEVFKEDLIFKDLGEIQDILYVIEEFMRMRMGQFFTFTDDVAENGWVYDNTKPDNGKKFSEFIARRNLSQDMFDKAFRDFKVFVREKSEKVLLAEDLYDVLKHQIYLDTPSMHDNWTVYSNKPMNWSGVEPVPKIEKGDF